MTSEYMQRALDLAASVQGSTSPNPWVGCVIVRDGTIVGEGATEPPPGPHAEAVALQTAGEAARGATAYVTLEPHNFHGRTPPCTDALIAAGVTAAHVAILDPNPEVSGKGVEQLRAAGMEVTVRDGEGEASRLLEAYLKHRRTGLPFVTVKFAATLDGKIAAASGDSRWIAGDDARAWAHEHRTKIDAIMCGVNNVLLDDPQLTARPKGVVAKRQPLRIVADSRGRTPLDAKVLGPGGKTLIATTAPEGGPAELERGVRELGLVAVALPTSAGSVVLDDRSLGPIWRKIQDLDVPVILHPALLPQGFTTDYGLERSCGRPFDTTLAAVRIMNAVFPEFPDLKFVLPHLGGTSVFLRGRISMISFEPPDFDIPAEKRQIAKTQREQRALGLDQAFEERWSKFYYDTAGTGGWAPAVEMTAAVVTARRMVFGSDYPLESTSGETVGELVEMVGNLRLPVEDRRLIAGETAAGLFRL